LLTIGTPIAYAETLGELAKIQVERCEAMKRLPNASVGIRCTFGGCAVVEDDCDHADTEALLDERNPIPLKALDVVVQRGTSKMLTSVKQTV
jgi:hypothetical protein